MHRAHLGRINVQRPRQLQGCCHARRRAGRAWLSTRSVRTRHQRRRSSSFCSERNCTNSRRPTKSAPSLLMARSHEARSARNLSGCVRKEGRDVSS